jgi:hypothetical protein
MLLFPLHLLSIHSSTTFFHLMTPSFCASPYLSPGFLGSSRHCSHRTSRVSYNLGFGRFLAFSSRDSTFRRPSFVQAVSASPHLFSSKATCLPWVTQPYLLLTFQEHLQPSAMSQTENGTKKPETTCCTRIHKKEHSFTILPPANFSLNHPPSRPSVAHGYRRHVGG